MKVRNSRRVALLQGVSRISLSGTTRSFPGLVFLGGLLLIVVGATMNQVQEPSTSENLRSRDNAPTDPGDGLILFGGLLVVMSFGLYVFSRRSGR